MYSNTRNNHIELYITLWVNLTNAEQENQVVNIYIHYKDSIYKVSKYAEQ